MFIVGGLTGPTSPSSSQPDPIPQAQVTASVAEASGADASGDAGTQSGDTGGKQGGQQSGISASVATVEPAAQITKVEAIMVEQALTESAPEEAQIALEAAPMAALTEAEAQAGAAPTVAQARYTELAGLMAQPPEGQGLDQRS